MATFDTPEELTRVLSKMAASSNCTSTVLRGLDGRGHSTRPLTRMSFSCVVFFSISLIHHAIVAQANNIA